MTELPGAVRALLACPRCHGPLTDGPADPQGAISALQCAACRLAFPVERGIPVLLVDRAAPLAPK
jgi:uncharacterized protein YbaR (Trm112 family)